MHHRGQLSAGREQRHRLGRPLDQQPGRQPVLEPRPVGPSFTPQQRLLSLAWSGGTYYPSGERRAAPDPDRRPAAVLDSAAYPPTASRPPCRRPSATTYSTATATRPWPTPCRRRPTLPGASRRAGAANYSDDRQHPYWRTELMQKAMNLTTVRTHQYAVWITVGFFEVKRQGDIGMLAQATASSPSTSWAPRSGRSPATTSGSAASSGGSAQAHRVQPRRRRRFHNAIVYRKVIQ